MTLFLPDLILEWPSATALAVLEKLIHASDLSTGPKLFGFAYFFYRNLREMKIKCRVNRAEKDMSETMSNIMKPTWINIIHSFIVLYTNCRRPR